MCDIYINVTCITILEKKRGDELSWIVNFLFFFDPSRYKSEIETGKLVYICFNTRATTKLITQNIFKIVKGIKMLH